MQQIKFRLMLTRLFFSRVVVLSLAWIILVFSCGYVVFSNEKTLAQFNKNTRLTILEKKQSPLAKKFLHHPRLAVSKKISIASAVYFVFLYLPGSYKKAVYNIGPHVNYCAVTRSRVRWLCMWRI